MRDTQRISATGNYCAHGAGSEIHSAKSELFREEVCQVYDLMVEAGVEPVEAIRKTRSALRAINYPFATYDYVMAKLRASGRLRKNRLVVKSEM